MSNFLENLIAFVLGLILVTAVFFVFFVAPTFYLWNWLMPVIFGLPMINFWEAAGLVALSTVLIKPAGSILGGLKESSKNDKN